MHTLNWYNFANGTVAFFLFSEYHLLITAFVDDKEFNLHFARDNTHVIYDIFILQKRRSNYINITYNILLLLLFLLYSVA